MLNRSFKPAKCKTALKLATSRLKLMKNRKLVLINQMKRKLSQLLETGQDRTARIQVEHVIREEKMVAAYDLIEIYCELIAARLPIIESQKSCPIDLKEAVTSVIYASPRCSDIPELQDARKHFATKYGKVFISAAIDLVPNCGVSRMLIEKLSIVAPDVQTKIKVMTAVAEEYNIKWDPKAFEEKESKPPDDLLNGPNTFEKASVTHAAPPNYQAAPNVQVPYAHEQGRSEPFNHSQQNSRSSLGTDNYASTNTGGIQTTSTASLADARSSGSRHERMEVTHSFPKDDNENLYDRKNWNMEFTDATSAAQAAAESAERASMAARAAAQLSRQERRSGQYSTDSQKSSYRDQEPQRYDASDSPSEYYSKGSYNNSFSDRKPKDQQMDRGEIEDKAAEKFNEDGYGRRSGKFSTDSQKSSYREQEPQRYGASNSPSEHYSKGSYNNSLSDKKPKDQQMDRSEIEDKAAEKFNEDGYERRSGKFSTDSHKSSYREQEPQRYGASDSPSEHYSKGSYNSSLSDKKPKAQAQKIDRSEPEAEEEAAERFNEDGYGRRSNRTASLRSRNGSVHDDNLVNNEQKSNPQESSFQEKFDKAEKGKTSSPEMSIREQTRRASNAELDKSQHDSFKSDNYSYHGEEKNRNQSRTSSSRSHSMNLSDKNKETTTTSMYDGDVADDVTSDESESDEDGPRFDSGIQFDEADAKSFFPSPDRELPIHSFERTNTLSPKRTMVDSVEKTGFEPNNLVSAAFDLSDGTVFDNEDEPDHKKINEKRLYLESPKRAKSPTAEPMPTPIIKSSNNSSMSRVEHKKSRVSQTASGSDVNYLSFKSTQEETKKSRFEPPPRFFDHGDDDSEDDMPKRNSSSKVHFGTQLSRRTKRTPSTSGTNTSPKNQFDPDTNPVDSASVETTPETRSHARNFKQESSKPIPEIKIMRREESFKSQTEEHQSSGQSYATPRTHSASLRHEATREKPESKSSKREESLKSQAAEQPSISQRKRVESSVPKLEKASSSGGGISTEENTVQKASHVHPKLPDYEEIAARFQALRMNR